FAPNVLNSARAYTQACVPMHLRDRCAAGKRSANSQVMGRFFAGGDQPNHAINAVVRLGSRSKMLASGSFSSSLGTRRRDFASRSATKLTARGSTLVRGR